MSSFRRTDIRWPADSSEFERACARMFGDWLKDPSPQRIGTSGAAQSGVDILCHREGDQRLPVGVQCKLRLSRGKLTKAMVREEVDKALKFTPTLTEYYVVTTVPNDTALQQLAAELAKQQSDAGREIVIQVWGADTLIDRINQSEVAKDAFDPEASPALARQEQLLGQVIVRQNALADKDDVAELKDQLERAISRPSLIPQAVADRLLFEEFSRALRRRGFAKVDVAAELCEIADRVIDGDLASASAQARAEVCDRAARAVSLSDQVRARALKRAASACDPDRDLSIVDALLKESEGDADAAIRALRDRQDLDGRTSLTIAVARNREPASFLAWLEEEGLRPPDLLPVASLSMITASIEMNAFDKALSFAREIPSDHLAETPALLMVRAQLEVAELAPPGQRVSVLQGLPLDPHSIKLAEGLKAQEKLASAIDDLTGLIVTLGDLGLTGLQRFLQEYVLWLKLKNPPTKNAAMAQLAKEILAPETTLSRVRLALAFGVSFDREALGRKLRRAKENGGWKAEEQFAAFLLAFAGETPLGISDFIAEHRQDLYAAPEFETSGLVVCEIEVVCPLRSGPP